jgi:hypothetical protein
MPANFSAPVFGWCHFHVEEHKGFAHAMPATEAETINADLLAFPQKG